jgi:hypothetical protein
LTGLVTTEPVKFPLRLRACLMAVIDGTRPRTKKIIKEIQRVSEFRISAPGIMYLGGCLRVLIVG